MLQSEFFERTKVPLKGEEYAEVEHIYNSVQMDKNEFCQLWLQNRNNKIIAELMNTIKKLEDDCQNATRDCNALTEEMEQMKEAHKLEAENDAIMYRNNIEEFGKKIIKAGEYDFPKDIYDAVEEEFGIKFIIRSKWEQSIELTEEEIDYMVKHMK